MITGAGVLIGIIGMGARYSFGIFLKSLEADFEVGRSATSSIFSVYMLGCAVVTILGGWAQDRYGPRKVGLVMATFVGLSQLMTSQTRHLWQLYISYSLFLSLGTGAIYTVVTSTTSRWFFKKRGFAVGITTSGGGVGTIVLSPFATFLISTFDWRTAFIVLGIISWVLAAAASLVIKKDPREMGLFPDGVTSAPEQTDAQKNRIEPQSVELSLKQASHMSQFWSIGSIWVLLSLSLHMIFVHVVPYAVDMGISPMDAAFTLSLIGFANIIGRLVVGKLSDAMDRRRLGTLCAIIQFVSFLWLLYARELWMLCAFAVVFGFLWGGSAVVVAALIGDLFGVSRLGIIMGMMVAGWSLGAAAGPVIGGYIFDATGHYFAAFATGAGAILMAAILLAFIRKVPQGSFK